MNSQGVYGRLLYGSRAMGCTQDNRTEENGQKNLNQYQMRLTKEQEINNPEAFVRGQPLPGEKHWGSGYKVEAGIGYSAVLCFLFDSDGSLWDLPL